MRVGVSPPVTETVQKIECAYPGCDNKKAMVNARLLGLPIKLSFAGLSHSEFEDAPMTRSQGADLAPEQVLNLRWHRLEYLAEHRLLGKVVVRLRSAPDSYGKVVSLANPDVDASSLAPAAAAVEPSGGFFPAVSQNKLYMEILAPRFGLTFTSAEPITNSSVVRQIPPVESEFQLEKPVKFKATRRWLPVELTVEECRISMRILTAIEIEVGEVEKSGDQVAIPFTFHNRSDVDRVKVAVMCESDCGVRAAPDRVFVEMERAPVSFTLTADLGEAHGPGKLYVQVILAEPYTSAGHNNVVIDYDELASPEPVATPA